jgi:two-component system, OmpR family, sensor kinase
MKSSSRCDPPDPAGAEEVAPAIPTEAFTPLRDEAIGPSVPVEALADSEPAVAMVDAITANLPPGTEMVSPIPLEDAHTFIATASHELRNPIHSLQVQLLNILRATEQEVQTPIVGWVHERVLRAGAQLERLVHLVDTLLDVTRIASGRLPLRLESVDLTEVAGEVIARLEPAERDMVTVRTSGAAIGHWDRLRLDQVVTNLVSNALKYGEGRRIEVVVRGDGQSACLEVTDNGLGIAAEDQQKVFERFERAVTDRDYDGFGLGLWITRRIVEELGGSISLRSTLGAGSTFTVDLPTS